MVTASRAESGYFIPAIVVLFHRKHAITKNFSQAIESVSISGLLLRASSILALSRFVIRKEG